MDDRLKSFLQSLEPFHREQRAWPNGFDLDIASFLHDGLPPAEFVTSVRTVLWTPDGVTVLHNPDGSHILPGGRREEGESLLETLEREVMEEAGCTIRSIEPLGFAHIHIRSAKPEDYPYPYPDLLQVIYAARGARGTGNITDPDGWETKVEFVQAADLIDTLSGSERVYLREGLRRLGVD